MPCRDCNEEKKKKMKKTTKGRTRVRKFYATYRGKSKKLNVRPVIGKVIPGKEYAIPESLANSLRSLEDWDVRSRYSYE